MSTALSATLLLTGIYACPYDYAGYTAYSYDVPYVYAYSYPSYGYAYSYPAYSYTYPAYGYSYTYPSYAYTYSYPSYSYSYVYPSNGFAYGYSAPTTVTSGYRGAPQGEFGAAGDPSPRRTVIVTMTDQARFQPAQITINVGDTVTWRNSSRQMHTVTADSKRAKNPALVLLPKGAKPFHSGEISPGGSFSQTFDVPGTYFYLCLPHEHMGMVGIVHVKGPNGPEGEDAPPAPDSPGNQDK